MPAGEAAPAVRCAALRCLVRVLATVDALPPSDSNLFTEYILPSLSLLPADGEEAVRVEYAGAIAPLAAAAHRFLLRLQHGAAEQAAAAASPSPLVRYEEEAAALRVAVLKVVNELVVGANSGAWSRRALLPHLPRLLAFLGRRHSNDYLLPTIITFLNDRDWQLRAAFFRHIACLAPTTGFSGLEAFLLPCVEQARQNT